MNKRLPFFLLIFLGFFSLIFPSLAQAAEFELTSIGASSTAGRTFSQWTYYGYNPLFVGTAGLEAEVEIQVDEEAYTTNADSNGDWTWQPTTLTEGSYEIMLSSGEETQEFTLVIRPYEEWADAQDTSTDSAGTSTDSADTLPETGGYDQTLLLIVVGVSLLGMGFGGRLLLAAVQD